jgi:Chaperone of endosialidase
LIGNNMRNAYHPMKTFFYSAIVGMSLASTAYAQSPRVLDANAVRSGSLAAPTTQDRLRPDALLQVDLHRGSLVGKIVEIWKAEIPAAQVESFRATLSGLRADQLLAASLSDSFYSVLEIVQSASGSTKTLLPSLGSAKTYYASQSDLRFVSDRTGRAKVDQGSAVRNAETDISKALGDANADLVYTPITPCRLFDTRAGQASALGTVGGQFSNQQTKTINPSAACGIPTAGVASLFLSFHAFNNNPAALGVIGFMKPAAPFSALAATWTGANWATGTYITQTDPNGSFDAFVGNGAPMTADMVVDVMGYFKAPGGVIGDITEIQTATGSGLTGGTASGVASLALTNGYKLPQACANGQVAKYNTSTLLWECSNDLQGTGGGGTGTVTNIATGAGLSGGPITTAGTINLASTQLLPTTACSANQIAKWNGTGWACAADATGAGTVTSVGAGFGLVANGPNVVGNAVVSNGVLELAFGYILPQGCTVGQIPKSNGSGIWNCAADNTGATVTNAFTQGGNAFGAAAVLGTTDLQDLTVKSGGTALSVLSGNNGGLRMKDLAFSAGGPIQVFSYTGTNVINGSQFNTVSASVGGATVSGGGAGYRLFTADPNSAQTPAPNQVIGNFGTVAGGNTNTAGASGSVGGGAGNVAGGFGSAVSGGSSNEAGGVYSSIPGGDGNKAYGNYSFAGGRGAASGSFFGPTLISDHGAFVWADSNSNGTTAQPFASTATDQFSVRARGGVNFRVVGTEFASSGAGCSLPPGGGASWSCSSDRNLKEAVRKISASSILDRVSALPITSWQFKGTPRRHIGPMAQDFYAAFGLGIDNKNITVSDVGGVALAAIQGLHQIVKERDAKILALEKKAGELDALRAELAAIKKKLGL